MFIIKSNREDEFGCTWQRAAREHSISLRCRTGVDVGLNLEQVGDRRQSEHASACGLAVQTSPLQTKCCAGSPPQIDRSPKCNTCTSFLRHPFKVQVSNSFSLFLLLSRVRFSQHERILSSVFVSTKLGYTRLSVVSASRINRTNTTGQSNYIHLQVSKLARGHCCAAGLHGCRYSVRVGLEYEE